MTVLTKNKIDFNAASSTVAQHFYGTSITATQFFSKGDLRDEILCKTDTEFTSILLRSHQK